MKRSILFLCSFFFFLFGFYFVQEEKNNDTQASSKVRKEKKEKTSGALEALTFWTRSRAFPNDDIPDAGFADALHYSREKLRTISERKFSSEEWKSIGPTNIGGRTISIAINPQNPSTIYAGSASGGLWRSHTGGEGATAWKYVDIKDANGNYYAVLGVGAIAIDPTDTNTILIGTGEVYGYGKSVGGFGLRTTRGSYGIGILKTTDGGETWTHPVNWERKQKQGVQDIAMNPKNPNIVYAATTDSVLKSTNKGESWFSILDTIMSVDILVNPIDTNIIFVSCGNLGSRGSGVYRSTNSGFTFTKIDTLPKFSGKTMLSISEKFPNVVYADVADSTASKGLWRSTDNGVVWRRLTTTDYALYQGWFSHFAVVHPKDTSKILCGGVDVWKSTNGGKTLSQKSYWYNWYLDTLIAPGFPEGTSDYSHADHHAYAIHPTDSNTVYFGNDGGIFRTTNFGETFQSLNGGYHTQQFYNGSSNSFSDSNFASGGMQDNATAMYFGRNDGAWYRCIGGDGCWTAIDQKSDSVVYGSAQYLYMVKNVTRGRGFWNYTYGGVSNVVNFVAPYVLSPYWNDTISTTKSRVIYAGEDVVSKSTDGGITWTTTNNNLSLDGNAVLSLAVSVHKPDTVYAGTLPMVAHQGIWKTINGGTAWTKIDTSSLLSLPNRYPLDIAIDEQNASRAFVVFGGFETSHLFKTIDGGQTWFDCDRGRLPNIQTNAVFIDPKFRHNIYVGNDIGVFLYAETSSGDSVINFSEGMPPAIVMDLSISRSNRMLRAFTHGLGAWQRRLWDSTLAEIPEPQEIPLSFELKQNFPNPFNSTTTIRFEIPVGAIHKLPLQTTLKIYNVIGQEVATLIHNKQTDIGMHEVRFDASNFSSGIYFYQLFVGTNLGKVQEISETKKMILLK
ncbi:MAG: T9SS type A sorting domain-containing protein [Ignavibacteria bacterium]|nr:T9SS type A sorting domain-containing protein [Ignavibacteria bacterium]